MMLLSALYDDTVTFARDEKHDLVEELYVCLHVSNTDTVSALVSI